MIIRILLGKVLVLYIQCTKIRTIFGGEQITTHPVCQIVNVGLFGIRTMDEAIRQIANLLGQISEALFVNLHRHRKKQTECIQHRNQYHL